LATKVVAAKSRRYLEAGFLGRMFVRKSMEQTTFLRANMPEKRLMSPA
jgi:hypothetical protein